MLKNKTIFLKFKVCLTYEKNINFDFGFQIR